MEIAQKLPYSIEAEQSVLGAIIIDASVMDAIVPILKQPNNFYAQSHQRIYEVMLTMRNAGQAIDFVTLLESVKAAGIFSEEEGKSYLLQLTQIVPSIENAANYAKIVANKAVLRQLIAATDKIRALCEEGAEDSSAILENAERAVYDIANGRTNTDLYSIQEGYTDAIMRYGELAEDGGETLLGVPTGFADIDNMLSGGMRKSELIILAARPAVGKSAFALNICENAAIRHGIKTVFFSLEMSKNQLVDRVIASQSLVDNAKLMTGALDAKDWSSIAEAGKFISPAPLYFDDASDITISQMKAKLRRVKDLGLVVIDYLQLMTPDTKNENRVQVVSEMTRALKIMAKELDVPVVCLSQLSRKAADQGSDRKPKLSDLRESGSIEQDADIVIFLHNENQTSGDVDKKCVIEAIVGKNRRGRCGTAQLLWVGKHTRFFSVDKKHDDQAD